jgi:carboxyl-terminal processing protease
MRVSKRYVVPAVLLFVLGTVLGMQIESVMSSTDTFEQLRKLEEAFLIVDRQYVESVDARQLSESAITGMLERLDPHSVFISADEARSVQEGYQGAFGGIGIWFESPPDDTAQVTSTIAGGPSESLGIMAGDRIVAVNDTSVVGWNSLDIQKRLKGPIGTTVSVTIQRSGVRQPLPFIITRGRIPLYSIDSSYMIDGQTGYLRIGRFAMTTHQEFLDHLGRLKAQGMKRLVLDLRDNPGGIKDAAVEIADEFLPGGRRIVYTQGRNPQENENDVSTPGGVFETQPVIVLVNENAASGSEILAGALQDHDRALVVGRRTFGKALVQRPFQLRDGSILQLTVSRYYTPSGRLIQTAYETGDYEDYYETKFANLKETFDPREYAQQVPDSLKFTTTHGRMVFGGGGILPDVVLAPDTTSALFSPLVQAVVQTGANVLFVREWYLAREQTLKARWQDQAPAFYNTFEVDEAMWQDFWAFAAREQDLRLTDTPAEASVEQDVFTRADAEASRSVIETILKARLAQRLYGSEAWFPVFNRIDPTVTTALTLWPSAEELTTLSIRPATGRGTAGSGR